MLRVLVVDDEDLGRLRLKALVVECRDADGEPLAKVVAEAGRAADAVQALASEAVDLVLLDVQMPGLDGVSLAAQLQASGSPPMVIFVTAHAEHAVRAFELDAVDYLTKPVRRDRLQQALHRALERQAAREAAARSGPQTLVVSDRGRMERVPIDEVLYLKAELKYVTVRTRDREYVVDESLSDLEQRFGDRLIRVHRNALVARQALRSLERRVLAESEGDDPAESWAVRIAATDEWLLVSRRQLPLVRDVLASHR